MCLEADVSWIKSLKRERKNQSLTMSHGKDIEMAPLGEPTEIPNGTRSAIENRYDFLIILCGSYCKSSKSGHALGI